MTPLSTTSGSSWAALIPSGCDALHVPIDSSSAFGVVLREVARQDEIHPKGFQATRDGVRFGLATVEDELRETLEAWNAEKRLDGYWPKTEEELVQTIAVAVRMLRSLHAARGPSFDE